MRANVRPWRIGAVISRLKTEARRGECFDRAAYRERNAVERTIRRLKQHRAIANCDKNLEESYHALVTLTAILPWLLVCRRTP